MAITKSTASADNMLIVGVKVADLQSYNFKYISHSQKLMYFSFKFEANSTRIGDTMMFEKTCETGKSDSEKIDGKV